MNKTNTPKGRKAVRTAVSFALILAVALCFTLPQSPTGAEAVYAASKIKAPKSVKITAEKAKSLKVTWKKVKGASTYRVYMAKKNMVTGKIGKYKKIKTIKAKATLTKYTYTKKKLKAGTKYYFKIRAYKGKTKGKLTKAKSAYARKSGPKITKAEPLSNSGALITWKKVKGATKYEVQVKVGAKGEWKILSDFSAKVLPVKTSIIGGAASGSSNFAGKTIYVRIRATSKIGKISLASVWGPTKKITIPKKSKYKDVRDDPNYYFESPDEPYSDKYGRYYPAGVLVDGGFGAYLSHWGYGSGVFKGCGKNMHFESSFSISDPACTVMWTNDGSEPSLTHGTKVTKAMTPGDGYFIWQDRNSHTVKMRGFIKGKQVFYMKTTFSILKYYEDYVAWDRSQGYTPLLSYEIRTTDGYYTEDNPAPPHNIN